MLWSDRFCLSVVSLLLCDQPDADGLGVALMFTLVHVADEF